MPIREIRGPYSRPFLMRSGADYREALKRDGRNVWVLGVGPVEDVTEHPATKPMVDEYVAWYDRHADPEWQDILLTGPDAKGHRRPLAFEVPRSADDLRRLGRAVSAVHFTTGGNMTHTPGYGALIALGILDAARSMNLRPAEIEAMTAYRDLIAETGRFLTFSSGGAPIGFRFREEEKERAALRVVRQTDAGVVVSGKVSMHTSVPYAEDVFIAGGTQLDPDSELRSWFIVSVAAPGVRVVCRRPASRHESRFVAPLSNRFDELDAQMWLEEVLVPWDRVITSDSPGPNVSFSQPLASPEAARRRATGIASWLFWHQHYGWLAKAEFTLGLGLALAEAMGLKENPATLEQLVDLMVDVQTARSCVTAAELDPEVTQGGFLTPGQLHVASASIYTLKARQRMSEILRSLPGSSMVVAPADSDFADEVIARNLEEAFGGGGFSAKQRAALLQLAWDHVSSGLDGRESAFELHANGGVPAWRQRLRQLFDSYNDLANGVMRLIDIEMPAVDLSGLRLVAGTPRRQVTAEAAPKPAD